VATSLSLSLFLLRDDITCPRFFFFFSPTQLVELGVVVLNQPSWPILCAVVGCRGRRNRVPEPVLPFAFHQLTAIYIPYSYALVCFFFDCVSLSFSFILILFPPKVPGRGNSW
jgi:hypothetical protein